MTYSRRRIITADSITGQEKKDVTGQDVNTKRGIHAFILNTTDDPVPVELVGASGTKKKSQATVSGTVGTDITVTTITITADKVFNSIEVKASATFTVLWKLIQHDDGTDTTLITEASKNFEFKSDVLEITAGSSGTQELRLIGNQIKQPSTDLHGFLAGVESA